MGGDDNIITVTAVYEAFVRGDVAAVLEAVSERVNWAEDTASTIAPWYGVRRGKAGVAGFFEAFASEMDVEEFTPLSFAANETDVLTVVRLRVRVRATGRAATMNLHHYFRFRDGKIVYYRGSEDTAQTIAVLRAETNRPHPRRADSAR